VAQHDITIYANGEQVKLTSGKVWKMKLGVFVPLEYEHEIINHLHLPHHVHLYERAQMGPSF